MADQHSSENRRASQSGGIEDTGDSRGFLQVAEEHRREGEIETAVDLLLAGLEKHPNYIAAQVALGRCYLELGEPSKARPILDKVVDQDVTHLVAAKLLVETHIQRGNSAQAERQLDLYTVLNNSDPDIEPLRARIEAMASATGETSTGSRAAGEGETIVPADPGAAEEAAQETERDLDSPHDPTSSESPPASQTPRSLSLVEPGEPFPSLHEQGLERRYLEQLGGDGIFPVAASALPEQAAADSVEEQERQPEVAPASDQPPVSDQPPATVTVAELYLAQGHEEDAKRIYREVLVAQPEHEAAKLGLARLESTVSVAETLVDSPPEVAPPAPPEPSEPGESPANDAMETAPQGSLLERKKRLLMRYLQTLRQQPEHDVS